MEKYYLGIDVGSTTIKLVLLNEESEIVKKNYQRHYSDISKATKDLFLDLQPILKGKDINIKVTGSGGLGVAKWLGIPFVQEVIACSYAVDKYIPQTDVAIELGGEDAKITYFGETIDQRMNGSCAGGTGAFVDQMAVLLDTDATGVNELAKSYEKLYPIAARCGVFAKTDIQPLINEGVSKSDIAASIYQAVVNQTISGLAAGKPIVGNVAFLGGPLSFSTELKKRFVETLQLLESEIVTVENPMLFVAIGTALSSSGEDLISFDTLLDKVGSTILKSDEEINYLDPLFNSNQEYQEFKDRHNMHAVKSTDINEYHGDAFLGIDAGSTTSKLVLISSNKELLYSDYRNNLGNPLGTIKDMLIEMYQNIHSGITIKYSGATGYGEKLINSAFKLDLGEIETLCHYKAAAHFNKDVDFILDIGGQDMKCMRIKNGIIYDIMLNEACSSGCGSFIEGFAKTLGVELKDFVKAGIESKAPVELGSRCTVFMNSKVKQAQKEGASVSDISAGLAYSVIKNALVKVIKVNDFANIGKNIVVQGGTFYNDAVLRAFEKVTNCDAVRPNISGLMGAFGVAIIANDKYYENKENTNTLSANDVNELSYTARSIRCNLCENKCNMTMNVFNDGSKFISGNKCERGSGVESESSVLPNLYQYKYDRLFNYHSLDKNEASRGVIGIPRVLNIYEHYPFWHTLFTELGYSVVLSPRSNKAVYEMGMDTITSDTVCYPAKLVHGHIKSLLKDDINKIFYPCIPYEEKFRRDAVNNYNCPIVISYPEVIKNNMEFSNTKFITPFIPMNNMEKLAEVIVNEFADDNLKLEEVNSAVLKAKEELDNYRLDVQNQGEKVLAYMKANNKKAILLAGRPYHIDPEINHGLEKIITELGMVVLSEDSIAHLATNDTKLRVMDQWSYHSRLYSAAEYVANNENIELVQLNSFGCGIDAIVTEQVREMLARYGKNYSVIKIDEGNNTGAIRIRLRSIQAALIEREKNSISLPKENINYETPIFTKQMKKDHTILVPQMSPIHSKFLGPVLSNAGYKIEILPAVDKKAIDEGVKYVNNDSCYPAIIVIGQLLSAIKSGKYDIDNLSVMMSQTGGGCRASNYVGLLKKALVDAGYKNIPVISFNFVGLDRSPGFNVSKVTMVKLFISVLYGDLLMRLSNRVRPYEIEKGSTDKLIDSWVDKLTSGRGSLSIIRYKKNINEIIDDFESIPIEKKIIPRVGVVGEILIKYHPTGNNELFRTLEEEGAEVIAPDLMDFVLYCAYCFIFNHDNLGTSKKAKKLATTLINVVDWLRKPIVKRLKDHEWFSSPTSIYAKIEGLKGIVSAGNQTGEGWFLTAEMMELLGHGVNNVIAVQPFGCLPNHIFAKSVIKPIKNYYPKANIIAIDYDPGLSEVNQLNRIKLLLEMAKKNL